MSLKNHSKAINPLANPKGTKLECELCGKPAYLQCKTCRVTYYCDKEHEALDYRGIHQKICEKLIPIRSPATSFGSESERAIRQKELEKQQQHLLEVSRTEADKLIFEGQFDLAIPAALQTLRFSILRYGQNSLNLVSSYLLLGKATTGLKQFSKAQEYLSLAKWAILKSPDCDPNIRGLLHRNIGILYMSQGKFDSALHELSLDVYYHSIAHNPDHISATGGYFEIGNIFHKQNRIDLCTAYFDKVIAIWKTALIGEPVQLDAAQIAEVIHMLNTIHAFRKNYSKSQIATAEVNYVMAALYYSIGDLEKAKELGTNALSVFETTLGREHSITTDARNLVKLIIEDSVQSKSGITTRRSIAST